MFDNEEIEKMNARYNATITSIPKEEPNNIRLTHQNRSDPAVFNGCFYSGNIKLEELFNLVSERSFNDYEDIENYIDKKVNGFEIMVKDIQTIPEHKFMKIFEAEQEAQYGDDNVLFDDCRHYASTCTVLSDGKKYNIFSVVRNKTGYYFGTKITVPDICSNVDDFLNMISKHQTKEWQKQKILSETVDIRIFKFELTNDIIRKTSKIKLKI